MLTRIPTSNGGRAADSTVRIEDAITGGELGGSDSGWLLNSHESMVKALALDIP